MTNTDQSMNGEVCLVTGAASGIGAMTARALAQRGATVILVDRDAERGAATAGQIEQETGGATVEFIQTDLSSQQEIRQLAQQVKSRHPRLDVLLNNAGAIFSERRETVDGIEMTFGLNYLGYFLLTHLLLDLVKAGAPARIINTSSRAHARAQMNFDDLQSRVDYVGIRAYEKSKLAIVLFTYELARRLAGTGVTVNALHPGIVATNFSTRNPGMVGSIMRWMAKQYATDGKTANPIARLLQRILISPEQGAQTGIYLATSPDVAGVTGKYFVKCKAVPSAPASYDSAAARRLWDVSEELTGISGQW